MFSSVSTVREDWGIGICCRNYMETYRNYNEQISSNIMSMEINMHGNPMVIVSAYMPHDESDDNPRDCTWEDLNGYIRNIPQAVNVTVIPTYMPEKTEKETI